MPSRHKIRQLLLIVSNYGHGQCLLYSGNSYYDYVIIEVCQYYKAIGPPVTVYQDYAHLVKVFSKNRFPCLQCKFTRSKAKSTAKHMDEKSHWPWTSENAQAGGEVRTKLNCNDDLC